MSKIPPGIYDEFELKGYWWTIGNEEERTPGILSYSKSGIQLELFKSYKNEKPFNDTEQSYNRHQIVLGETSKGLITLIDGFEINSSTSFNFYTEKSFTTSNLIFNTMITGTHYNDLNEIKLPSLTVYFSNLEMWLQYQPFENVTEEKRVGAFSNIIKTFEIYIDCLKMKISSTYTIYSKNNIFEFEHLNYQPFIVFTPDEPKSLEWFQDVIWKFKNFLSVLMDSNVYIESIKYDDYSTKTLNVYTVPFKNYKKEKLERLNVFRIDLPSIQDNLEEILNKWYSNNIESSILLYMQSLTRDIVFEDLFLVYTKAIESAHRDSNVENKFICDEEYTKTTKKMLSAVKGDIPNDLYNKLDATLKYANEFGFQRRIKEIVQSLNPSVQELILVGKTVKDYADMIRVNRDYYTHYGDESDILFKPNQFFIINRSLKLIVLNIILREINISDDVFVSALEHDGYFVEALQNGASLF
ncbi:HEPN domain-containing protein [Paenibacillus sp. J2TS4]|uniref:ApeA N-terminal domain 1-containing protein n=1 Tax=Paenibacillus sp. J2TS4 TaxID=2807194 RepID=UPI001B1FBCCA|nr:HEPN domain-containing protein [Paenibacillus sp. J2TS4]GIP33049.1 hypothetical protein J2TS4_22590 [Paenibacillus sp. J2TS4]